MKKLNVTLVLILISVFSFAGVLTVDNRTGSGAQYSTLGSAINAATNGDTIYLHPSNDNYGNISLNKGLVFIGPGHHPEFTGGLGASILTVTLQNGSSNSKFIGLMIKEIKCATWATSQNIEITNNFFSTHRAVKGANGDGSSSDNWIIQGNVIIEITGGGGFSLIDIDQGSESFNANWIIRNNFIQSKTNPDNTNIFGNLNVTIMVENNIIFHQNSSSLFNDNSSGGELRNNIIWLSNSGMTDLSIDAESVVFSNNLTYNPSATMLVLSGDNNIDNSDPDFSTLDSDDPIWNYLNDYQLSATSSGADAGEDGSDVGIHGGGYNFRMEGYPQNFPRFIYFDVLSNTIVPPGGTIDISINATRAGL